MTMSRIRGRDTKVEMAVRKELHRRGHCFRVNVAWIAGKPDVIFTKIRLAVFIDGDFGLAGNSNAGRTSWLRTDAKKSQATRRATVGTRRCCAAEAGP